MNDAVLMGVIDGVADLAGVVSMRARSIRPSREMTVSSVSPAAFHDDEKNVGLLFWLSGSKRCSDGSGKPAGAARSRSPKSTFCRWGTLIATFL